MKPAVLCTLVLLASAALVAAQEAKPKPEDTEVWKPVPPVVTPGATCGAPPSDAIILFDGKNEDEWVSAQDHTPAKWIVGRRRAHRRQRHWQHRNQAHFQGLPAPHRVADSRRHHRQRPGAAATAASFSPPPAPATTATNSRSSTRGNNPTYVNGMAGSLYKQAIPAGQSRPQARRVADLRRGLDRAHLQRRRLAENARLRHRLLQRRAGRRTTSSSRARPSTSASPSTRSTTARPSSSRPTATRASRSASAISGSASSRDDSDVDGQTLLATRLRSDIDRSRRSLNLASRRF